MMPTAPDIVSLQLPDGWIEIDPREPDIAGALQRAIDVPPGMEEQVVALLSPLAIRLSWLAAAGDVVLTGFYSEIIPIEGSETPFVVTAQVILAMSPPIGDLDEIRDIVGGDGVEVRPIDLPAGTGVLAAGTTEVADPSWDSPQPARLRRYFVPIPGMSRVAALSFLTPNLDLADQFDEVFDAIAATLAFD